MTCIVGLVDKTTKECKIYMGADGQGTDAYVKEARQDTKCFRKNGMLIGASGCYRTIQILKYHIDIPDYTGGCPEEFMVKEFIPAYVEAANKHGVLKEKDKVLSIGSRVLVGFDKHIFQVDTDLQVGSKIAGYAAIGSGQEVALGSLYSTKAQPARTRIRKALDAATAIIPSVGPPFRIISMST